MQTLEQLISDLCPNGVEFITIGTFSTQLNGMSGVSNKWKDEGNCRFIDYMNVYKNISVDVTDLPYATVKSLNKQSVMQKGDILFTSASETPLECALSSNIEGELPDGILLDDHLFAIRIKPEWKNKVSPSFIKYLFRAEPFRVVINKAVRGVTRFYISKKDFMDLEIPVPPMAVQKKIVEILDNFTSLTAELTAELQAELQARQQQYEYYRNRLLSFGGLDNIHSDDADEASRAVGGSADERNRGGCKLLKMREIGCVIRGVSFQKKDFSEKGYPCIHYGQIYTQYGFSATSTYTNISEDFIRPEKLAHKGDLIIATTSENLDDVGKSVVWEGDNDIIVSNDACIFRHKQNPRYIGYLIQSEIFTDFKKRGNCSGTKVIRMNPDTFLNFEAPIPTLTEQQRIVDILDRFEALINDIKQGLPAEIEARQQQYEYYRNKLLTFERLGA